MGCDVFFISTRFTTYVSIHAPVWGATRKTCPNLKKLGFNPRTRVGCDLRPTKHQHKLVFQSTHPCGVRLKPCQSNSPTNCFNPRTRVGCDVVCTLVMPLHRFNPRTRVGCDCKYASVCLLLKGFNPRTRVGCDRA